MCSRILLPLCFWVRGGHKRNMWEIWKVEVKEQPFLWSDSLSRVGIVTARLCHPSAGSLCLHVWQLGLQHLQLLPGLLPQLLGVQGLIYVWLHARGHLPVLQVTPFLWGWRYWEIDDGAQFVLGFLHFTSTFPFWPLTMLTSGPSSGTEAVALHRLLNWLPLLYQG